MLYVNSLYMNVQSIKYFALNALIFKLVYVLIEQEFLEMFMI